ncbi:molybdenum cofactor biosynthesis protein D [Alcanivorax hongdengensis A-11-3]|uniref:Molybdenum cofactor biosynthesis protein D n=1 Tax=Alcanivorax hongdengensis A-11-3 TaxID=1177179 RepID=L0WC01_9GAMM|nr:molybdopterin converting factor subunit 1 [Alcanivorax hongdengensis]EKF73627.1 molybdenum cofactor biosynthesis protein D [Alcanivorax hongdengensis A-11-3]
MIELRFFAALRERVGHDRLSVTPPEQVTTVEQLIRWLAEDNPTVASALAATPRYMVAINEELGSPASTLSPGDVVALFPPVTGG